MNIEEIYKTRNGVVNLVEIAQGIINSIPDADNKFMEPVVVFIDEQQSKIEELEKISELYDDLSEKVLDLRADYAILQKENKELKSTKYN